MLRDALLATGLGCPAFIFDNGMNLDRPIEKEGQKLVPFGASVNTGIGAVIVLPH